MTTRHEPWDSALFDRLDELRVDVHDLTAATDGIVSSLRRYGFAILSGLGRSNERDSFAEDLKQLAHSLGAIVPQSPRGEQVEDVRDFSDVDESDHRGYRSRGELSPHSDPSTLIVLHCLQPAKSGGESHIVNVRAIHDRMKEVDPELTKALFAELPFWCVEGQPGYPVAGPSPHGRPVFGERDGLISCVLYRPFIEMAAHALGQSLTDRQVAALDLFEECANSPDLTLRFTLNPGETLILHNRTVLHARTDYEDWPDPGRRRHLLRVWIDAPALLPVAPEHELGDLFAKNQ